MAYVNISAAGRNAMLTTLTGLLEAGSTAGTINIYDGTVPASPDTAVTTQVLLVTLTYSDPSHGTPSGGVITAATITAGTAVGTGTAAWARLKDSNGLAVMDCDVGTAATTIILNTTSITIGQTVEIIAATLSLQN